MQPRTTGELGIRFVGFLHKILFVLGVQQANRQLGPEALAIQLDHVVAVLIVIRQNLVPLGLPVGRGLHGRMRVHPHSIDR